MILHMSGKRRALSIRIQHTWHVWHLQVAQRSFARDSEMMNSPEARARPSGLAATESTQLAWPVSAPRRVFASASYTWMCRSSDALSRIQERRSDAQCEPVEQPAGSRFYAEQVCLWCPCAARSMPLTVADSSPCTDSTVRQAESQGADRQVVPRQCVQHSAVCRVKDSRGAVHGGACHPLPVRAPRHSCDEGATGLPSSGPHISWQLQSARQLPRVSASIASLSGCNLPQQPEHSPAVKRGTQNGKARCLAKGIWNSCRKRQRRRSPGIAVLSPGPWMKPPACQQAPFLTRQHLQILA